MLCQNPENGAYAIFRVCPLDRLDAEALGEEVGKLANSVEMWKKLLEDFRAAGGLAGAQKSGGDEDPGMPVPFSPDLLRI